MKGQGVESNATEGVKWFRKSAEQGNPPAEYSLGLCYFEGRGVPKNVQQALVWYRKAAGQNQADAIGVLADIYLAGSDGVKLDYAEACAWCQKGAALGNPDCLNGLGFLYEQGVGGVSQNGDEAVKYFSQAAAKGFKRAYVNLGRMYQVGDGVKADPVEAYKWFTLGARVGDPMAGNYQQTMLQNHALSDSDLSEASRRVTEYLAQLRAGGRPQGRAAVAPN